MLIETIEAETRPMLYITRFASMNPEDIAATMKDAFAAIAAFLGQSGVRPAGPPLAVYHDRDPGTGRMTIDLCLPVTPHDIARAMGEVRAGQTPSGRALKAVHHGPYGKLGDTYAALEDHMRNIGLPVPASAWEVYVSDPETTPAEDLVTEIYMPIA